LLNYERISTNFVNCPVCAQPSLDKTEKVSVKDYLNISGVQDFIYTYCRCGVYYLTNQPITGEIAKIYPSEYQAYSRSEGLVSKFKKWRLKSLVSPYVGNGGQIKILDYGCGSGEFILTCSELVGTVCVGYDINPPRLYSDSNIVFTDKDSIVANYGHYNLIFSFQVIEHVSDPLKFLIFLNAQLTGSGRLIIETPSSSGILFSRYLRKFWGGWHAPRHFVIFDRESLSQLCKKAGLQIETFSYIPSPFQWIETFRPLMGRFGKQSKLLSLENFPLVLVVYTLDLILILLRFKSSNMKFVLKKSEASF
jgi:SAM-dependent methyltransferase